MRLFEYQRSATVTDPAALLRRIVLSLAINHYRRELSVPVTFESIDRLDRCGVLTDPTPGPERTLAAEQELDCVGNLLGAMSPRTCQIFVAQRGGYSYEEIAAAFAIKPRTVEKHVTTAAEALWEYLTSGPDLLCNSPELSGPRLGDRTRIVRSPARTQIAARWPVTDGSLRPQRCCAIGKFLGRRVLIAYVLSVNLSLAPPIPPRAYLDKSRLPICAAPRLAGTPRLVTP